MTQYNSDVHPMGDQGCKVVIRPSHLAISKIKITICGFKLFVTTIGNGVTTKKWNKKSFYLCPIETKVESPKVIRVEKNRNNWIHYQKMVTAKQFLTIQRKWRNTFVQASSSKTRVQLELLASKQSKYWHVLRPPDYEIFFIELDSALWKWRNCNPCLASLMFLMNLIRQLAELESSMILPRPSQNQGKNLTEHEEEDM